MAKSVENGTGPVSNPAAKRWTGRFFLDAIAEAILNFSVFVFRFFWWSFRWTFATLFFLAMMAAAGYYVFNQAVASGEYMKVPNIVGMPVAQAYLALGEQKLQMGRQETMSSEQFPKNHVIAQRPAAGAVVRAGRRITPTVSSGKGALQVASFVGKTLDEARVSLAQLRLREGTVARLSNTAPVNTVLGQDPAPNQEIEPDGEVHFLVSDGPPEREFLFMPEIVGLSPNEALERLSPYRLTIVPYVVEKEDAPLDVILSQNPQPNASVRSGDRVSFNVRTTRTLPNARRKVDVAYTVPGLLLEREVRVEVVDARGERKTVYPGPDDLVGGLPPRLRPGSVITIPELAFEREVTVEFFVDGQKARTCYYHGLSEPTITDHESATEGGNLGGYQNSAVHTGQ
ncbi:MAG: PASTA domain-containing protein [Candidatus Hydrogenedentes bacterium]|nr:PASTA domain-containing protein [Candidatus Hydrogenedentota bacterium]